MGQKINPSALRAGGRNRGKSMLRDSPLVGLLSEMLKAGGILTADLVEARMIDNLGPTDMDKALGINITGNQISCLKTNTKTIKGIGYVYRDLGVDAIRIVENVLKVKIELVMIGTPLANADILSEWIGEEMLSNGKTVSEKKVIKNLFEEPVEKKAPRYIKIKKNDKK